MQTPMHMSVVHNRLLYSAQIWAESMNKYEKTKNLVTQSQRCAALIVAPYYRTVYDMAALALASMPPAFLLAKERKRNADRMKTEPTHCRGS